MKHLLRFAPHFLVVVAVAVAVLATGDENQWLVMAVAISLYAIVGWLLWATRGTVHNIFLVAIFLPILLPVAILDWMRRRITRPQAG